MEFQTKIPLKKQSKNQIDYDSNILLLGSCFSENIGSKLDYFKFKNSQNPFGILFHPKAIETLVVNAIEEKVYKEDDILFVNEQWHCFDAHSKLSRLTEEDLLQVLNNQIKVTKKGIQDASHIVITLGTAWMYRFIESKKVVANCHKVPQKEFTKELMSVKDIIQSLQNIGSTIKKVNRKARIIFTVSPVRHLKDGFIENTQSKSHLITAIHTIMNNNVTYFPSYEIMMDELRDYRFYDQDMVHPNKLAINYIWNKFVEVWISEASKKTMDDVAFVQKGIQHKPFNPDSEAHQSFLKKIEIKKVWLQSNYAHIEF